MTASPERALDEQIAAAEQMARDAAELWREQTDLQRRSREVGAGDVSQTERDIDRELENLARNQRDEARANARAAGSKVPISSAIARSHT